jgi:hypothetical protein
MKRWALIALTMVVSMTAEPQAKQQTTGTVDPKIPADVHSSLFQEPPSQQAGALTEQLTAGLAAPEAAEVPRANFIDEHIFGKMERDGVPHATLSSDREFIRRVRLDLTGRLPSPEEISEFLADASPAKRGRLIDSLVASPEFVDKWAYFLMDTLRIQSKTKGYKIFHHYLKQSLAADRAYVDLVSSFISSAA